MALEVTQRYVAPSRIPFVNVRWSAIFAGLAVGISTNLFLLLVGGAAGLAVFNTSVQPSGQSVAIAASIWNTVCMIIGAFVGGYVAARASGMRRSRDGLMHGAVSWGVTMLVSAMLAGSAAGATLSSMFNSIAKNPTASSTAASAAHSAAGGDRQAAMSVLQSRLGLNNDQASRIVDQAMVLSGREENAGDQGQAKSDLREGAKTASIATGWLSAAILLSLLAAMGGGMLGAKNARRLGGPELRRTIQRTEGETPVEGANPPYAA